MKIKPVIFFLTTILLFSSCNSKKNGDEIDCDYQKRQAQNNFKYGNYTWTIFMSFGYDYLGEDEFKKLLAKNNIKSKELLLSCLVSPNEKYDHCEEEEMNKLIGIKFGKKFIDSLKYIAKIDFLKKHPDEIFSFEQCDETPRFPGSNIDNQTKNITKEYFSKYPIPKSYIKKNEEYYSYTSANFILTKNGKVKDLSIETRLQNKKNNIFEKQFNTQLKNFVISTKWIPAKINGINVDSYYGVTIHYD